jgi:hypothetical protein
LRFLLTKASDLGVTVYPKVQTIISLPLLFRFVSQIGSLLSASHLAALGATVLAQPSHEAPPQD